MRYYFILLFLACSGHSQNQFLDYFVDKKGDTIYGTIRDGLRISQLYIKNPNPKNDKVAFYVKPIRNARAVRYNDKLYFPVSKNRNADPIYGDQSRDAIDSSKVVIRAGDYQCTSPKLPDYVVTDSGDTLYGSIRKPLAGKMYLESSGEKHKIAIETTKAYRCKNRIFVRAETAVPTMFGKRTTFLELLLAGRMTLLAYRDADDGNADAIDGYLNLPVSTRWFIQKNGELIPVPALTSLHKLDELFGEKPELVEKIKDKTYSIENMYLIVKYYNQS